MKTVVATTNHYSTAEPFIEYDSDIRLQKIGSNYKAIKRVCFRGPQNWKVNTNSSTTFEFIEVSSQFK
jgi:hypothetical protein